MEYQMEALYLRTIYADWGCRTGHYTPIFASGPNAAVLHYGHAGAPNDRRMRDGDLLLADAGAEYHRYAARPPPHITGMLLDHRPRGCLLVAPGRWWVCVGALPAGGQRGIAVSPLGSQPAMLPWCWAQPSPRCPPAPRPPPPPLRRYAADITCTFPVNGRFTPQQRLVYEAVLAANQAVIGAMAPGASWVVSGAMAPGVSWAVMGAMAPGVSWVVMGAMAPGVSWAVSGAPPPAGVDCCTTAPSPRIGGVFGFVGC